jgi:ribosomal protein S12 methylthiotransferase
VSLTGLLRRIAATGVPWIRVLYAHPAHVTRELLSAVAEEERVVPYLDLPIQHVSDRILAAMRRGIDGDGIRSLLARARRAVPGLAIRSSVMVGFPGETEEEYEELLDFVEGGAIDHLGVFEFSPEVGTRAHDLQGRVSSGVASTRARLLIEVAEELSARRGRARIGEEVTVLVDSERSARTEGQAWETDGAVLWEAGARGRPRPGSFARARISGAFGFDLTAEPLGARAGETP